MLLEVLKSGKWGCMDGDKVKLFQEKFTQYMDAKFGLCVTNGTDALRIALKATGVGQDHEVIIPPYTFLATATAVLDVGAAPIFVDIEPDTCNIDPEKIESAITPKTRAIMPVHIGGRPADLDKILDLARKHNLVVIEDSCQAPASEWKNRKVGAIGDFGAISFQSSKNITSGEGGFILTNNEQLYDKAWSIHNCGRKRDGQWYEHRMIGSNVRMTEFQAAILLAQLQRLPAQSKTRNENAALLNTLLSPIEGIHLMRPDNRITANAYHIYIIRFDQKLFGGLPRDKFIEALRAEGIPSGAGYVPLHQILAENLDPARYPDYAAQSFPITEKTCSEEAVWIKQDILLGPPKDMHDIAAAIKKIQQHQRQLLT